MSDTLGTIHDVREQIALTSGAIANLTCLSAGRYVPGHVHTNPYLSLHVLGSYRDNGDDGDVAMNGPTALFFPAGSSHEMDIGKFGLATVIIEFDDSILHHALGSTTGLNRFHAWTGGEVGRQASRLARNWLSRGCETQRFDLTLAFLSSAISITRRARSPEWLDHLDVLVDAEFRAPDVGRWVKEIGVTRAWLARAYRDWRAEGLGETIARRRVEAAAILMEEGEISLAAIAVQAGFCDQSHMNRAFRKFLGRTPAAARSIRLGLGPLRSVDKAPRRRVLHGAM